MLEEYEEDTQVKCRGKWVFDNNSSDGAENPHYFKSKVCQAAVVANVPLHYPLRTNQSWRASPALYQLTSVRQADIHHANTSIPPIPQRRGQ